MISAHIQSSDAKVMDGTSRCRWIMTLSILQKQHFGDKEMEYSSVDKSGAWSQTNRSYLSVTEDKTEQKTERTTNWSDGQEKHLLRGNSESGNVHGVQTSGSHWMQRIFTKVLKMMVISLHLCHIVQILLNPWKQLYFNWNNCNS